MKASQDPVYALAAVLIWASLCSRLAVGDDTTCTSPVISVLAAEDDPSGLRVTATAATPDDVEHQEITTLPGAHIPAQECGEAYTRCPLKCEENGAESMICSIPVTNSTSDTLDPSLALLHLKKSSELMGFQVLQEKLVPVPYDIDCVPVEVFDRGPDVEYRRIVACLNLRSPDGRYAYFLLLEHDRANISNARLVADTLLSEQYYRITEGNLSNLVYWEPSNTACFIRGNIFMKDGPRVVTFELRDSPRFRHLEEHHEIDNCPDTLDLSAFETDLLRIHCSAEDVVFYDVCRTETVVERYNTTLNGTVYQCSEARVNVFLSGTFLDIHPYGSGRDDIMDNVTLPFDDIIHAQCTGRETPVLFMARKSGETYVLFLTSGHLFYLAQNSCIGNSCLNLDILKTKYAYVTGIYDYASNEYIVANLSCSESPVIARIPYASPPALTALALGKNTQPCHCPPQQPTTEPMETPTSSPSKEPSSETPTEPTDPQVDDEIRIQTQGVQDDVTDGKNNGAVIGSSVSVSALVVVVVILIVVAIAIYIYKRKFWHSVSLKSITRLSRLPATTIPMEVEDDVSVGSVVPAPNPLSPTTMDGRVLVEVHNEHSNSEEKRNALQSKRNHMQAGAIH